MEVDDWVIEWFIVNSSVSRETIEGHTGVDYLKEGWIDSLQFISLVSEAEEEFDIEFSNEDFQDRSFATIEGLTSFIERKVP